MILAIQNAFKEITTKIRCVGDYQLTIIYSNIGHICANMWVAASILKAKYMLNDSGKFSRCQY